MVFSFNHTTNQMFRITLQNYQHKTIQHDSVKFCFESCFLNCAKCTTKNLQSNRTLYGNSCKIFFFISIYTLLFLKFLAIESHFFFSKVNLIHGCPTPPNFERLMASNSMLRLPLYIQICVCLNKRDEKRAKMFSFCCISTTNICEWKFRQISNIQKRSWGQLVIVTLPHITQNRYVHMPPQ